MPLRPAEARAWLAENEDLEAMTPERLAAIEAEKNKASGGGADVLAALAGPGVDEVSSPTAGRRFSRD